MQPQTQPADVPAWQWLLGRWATGQRFAGRLSDDGSVISGEEGLSRDDGTTWARDLTIIYRRIG